MKRYNIVINGSTFLVGIQEANAEDIIPTIDPTKNNIAKAPLIEDFTIKEVSNNKKINTTEFSLSDMDIKAPMSGTIFKLKVKVGDIVKCGDVAIILEAMKMENELFVSNDGIVEEIYVTEGTVVMPGDVLIKIGSSN